MRGRGLDVPQHWGHVRLTIHAWLVISLFFGPVAQSVLAATYFVNAATGDDTNSAAQAQSAATPWKTVSRALTEPTMISGDIIQVAPGTYTILLDPNEQFPKPLIDGVTLIGDPNDPTATILAAPPSNSVFRNDDTPLSNQTVLRGFTVKHDSGQTQSPAPLMDFEVGAATMSPLIADNVFMGMRAGPGGRGDIGPDVGIFYTDQTPEDGVFTASILRNAFKEFAVAGIFDEQRNGGAGDNFSPTIQNNTFTTSENGILFDLTATTSSSGRPTRGLNFVGSAQGVVAPQILSNAFGDPNDPNSAGNSFDINAGLNPRVLSTPGSLSFSPTISNNTFTGTLGAAITVSAGSTTLTFSSSGFGADNLTLSPTITNNLFGDPNDPNDVNGGAVGSRAISIGAWGVDGNFASNLTITGNTITASGNDAIDVSVTNLSQADGCAGVMTASDNIITNAGASGIEFAFDRWCDLQAPTPTRGAGNSLSLTVSANTITGTADDGIHLSMSSFSSVPGTVLIANNTISDAGSLGCSSTTTTDRASRVDKKSDSRAHAQGSRARGGSHREARHQVPDRQQSKLARLASGEAKADLQSRKAAKSAVKTRSRVRGKGNEGDGIFVEVDSTYFNSPLDMTIRGNTITGPADDGIDLSVSSFRNAMLGVTVRNNTISDAGSCQLGGSNRRDGGRGIAIEASMSSSSGTANVTVANNSVTDSHLAGIQVSMTDTFATSANQSVLVQRNTVTGGADNGLEVFLFGQGNVNSSSNDVQIVENVLRNNALDGLRLQDRGASVNPVLVSCNTITGNAANGVVQDLLTSVRGTRGGSSQVPADFGGGNRSSPGLNVIVGNATNDPNAVDFRNENSLPVFAENNFWGTTDLAAIDARVFDDEESGGASGAVDFDPPLAEAPGLAVPALTDSIVNDVGVGGPSYGDTLRYTLTLVVPQDSCACADVDFSSPIPANTTFVPGSLTATRGTVTESPTAEAVALGALEPGEQIVITWDVVIGNTGTEVTSQAALECLSLSQALSDDPDTQAVDDPTVTLLGFATPTPTVTATPTVTPTPGPLCSRADSCFLWELLAANLGNTTVDFTWRLTSSCPDPLTQADFRLLPIGTVTAPTEGGTYTSPNHTYLADVIGNPHPGVNFAPSDGDPMVSGESDTFTFTVDRAGLDNNTVFWNNAQTTAGSGRIDMRSSLCTVLVPAPFEATQACYRELGGGWRVSLSWVLPRESGAQSYRIYRLDAQGQPVLIHEAPLPSDGSNVLHFTDECAAGGATAYRLQPLLRANEPAGPPIDVEVQPCASILGSRSEVPQLFLLLSLLSGAALLLRRRQRPGRGVPLV